LLTILFSANLFVQSEITVQPSKQLAEQIILENDSVLYTLLLDHGVKLKRITDKVQGTEYLTDSPPKLLLSVRMPWSFKDVGYHLFTIDEGMTNGQPMISITQKSSYVENPLVLVSTFWLGDRKELHWRSTVENTATGGVAYRDPLPVNSIVRFPAMQEVEVGDQQNRHYFLPTQGSFYCIDSPDDFIFYFTNSTDPKMPIDIYNTVQDRGVYFHIVESAFTWNFEDKDDFTARQFQLDQNPGSKHTVIDCRISPHQGDWHAAFWAFKRNIRSNFDFAYYERPVQERYRQRLVSHFTFLYGKDIYDFDQNRFRIHEFLDEGELNFGGYDYMLLWHDYPRMGIDHRNQFDMYEGLPGGLEGVREMVDEAHSRDVQVFIPYKPWDIMQGRSDYFLQEARIAREINADGVFLDTMNESDIAFREALDKVNPDNVFVSEGRPSLAAAELVTGSWNQQGNATNEMPNVDLFRFVIPEHNVHNINRMARDRVDLIYNALFNGTGFIVWEDIFGEINRYTWNERIMIKRYSRIIHENRDAYLTDRPVPLIPSLHKLLFVNAFPSDEKVVYPAYFYREAGGSRHGPTRMDPKRPNGPFLELDQPADWHYVDVWNHEKIYTDRKNGKTRLIMPEEPPANMSCIVGMRPNLTTERTDDMVRISTMRPVENASIHIHTVDNLTFLEEEQMTIDGTSGTVDLNELDLDFPHKILIKLMQGDILKDEMLLYEGWKQFD